MEQRQLSQAYLRKRKMMLVLPLLAFPFVTMAFWALGGGKGSDGTVSTQTTGLNLNLPGANLKDDDNADKLSFYDRATKDSAKRDDFMRTDPSYNPHPLSDSGVSSDLRSATNQTALRHNQSLNASPYEGSGSDAERRLMERLTQLQRQLNSPESPSARVGSKLPAKSDDEEMAQQMNHLQTMMEGMTENPTGDSEMQQISSTLDKILDIQHPQRVKERSIEKLKEDKLSAVKVESSVNKGSISLIGYKESKGAARFHSIESGALDTADDGAIEAETFTSQTIVNGSVVKLRLTRPVYINGKLVPKGTYTNGLASLNNERLEIEISSVRSGNSLLPVRLTVYDVDGLPGLYVPGAISRDAAKQSADNGLQLLELSTIDPSLKAQLATAGVNSAKNLLSRKAKQVKIFIKAGYKVLLKNASTH